MGKLAQER